MITVIARWESTQLPPEYEWKQWRQLKNWGITRFIFTPVFPVAGGSVEQYATMEECLVVAGPGNRVFLEPTGTKGMSELPPREEPVIFVLGNTAMHNLSMQPSVDELYRINEPSKTDMYPTSAAAIALAYWVGQP